MRSVTIRDVAREAGFSVATVSNVLRGGQGHVYPESTYAQIRGTAERLGYQANAAARVLRQNNRTLIGMPVQLTEHPYLSRFLLAIQDELLKHDYDPIFLNVGHLVKNGDTAPFPPLQMLAGLITVGIELQSGWLESYSKLPASTPVVSLQPVFAEVAQKVDVIQVDFVNAYIQVCEYLMKLGHRNIAYLSGFNNPIPSVFSKNKGWAVAARKCGLNEKYLIDWKETPPHSSLPAGLEKDDFIYKPEGQQVIMEVVEKLQSFPQRITALVCSSDEVAIGIQSFLQTQGWKIPEELSIVGYDGISFGEFIHPSLTTVAPDYSLMSQAAVRQLMKRLDKSSEEQSSLQSISIKPQLIVRASTACVSTVTT